MQIVYIQDQEIECYNGEFYHSKSEHFFGRYLAGLGDNDTLTVYCGVIKISDSEIVKRYKKVSHPRIQFVQIPEFRKLGNLLAIFRQVKEIIKDADFCYLRCGIASSIAGYFCRKRGVPYMAILNEDVFKNLWMHPNKVFKLFAYPLSWMTHIMVKKANYACYVTQNYLQREYPCDGPMCGCSDIEFLELNPENLEKRYRKIEGINNKVVLGSVGSVSTKLKGQDTVIRTLAYLKDKGIDNYRYELVGTGNPQRLSELAANLGVIDLVEFKGVYSHEDVLKWFETIDIYVHPSHSEGLPRTILEAMTKATPCVCTKVGGVPELINDNCLFSYNGNEIKDLARILQAMSREKMKVEAEQNFEHSKDYDPSILEKRRSSFFENAINNSRHRNN